MSNEKESYSREFKAKVVLESVSGEQVNPQLVAEKYELAPAQILAWAREMDISDGKLEKLAEEVNISAEDSAETVEIETSNELFASEVEYGATYDLLNMKTLTYWTVFGALFVLLTIFSLMGIYKFSQVQTIQQVSERSEYHEVRELNRQDQEKLSSFGVIDLEEGIYRVPVDSVISRMAVD